MRRSFAAFVLAIPFVAGPATAQEVLDERVAKVHSISEVDAHPELIGCASAMLPTLGVPVDFVVDADGTVVPETVRGRSFDLVGLRHIPAQMVWEAEAIAQTCRFKPATRDGEAVAVRFSKRFAFQTGPRGHASPRL